MDKNTPRLSEGQLLQHLLQEAASTHGLDQDLEDANNKEFSTESQLQNMIENYQNHVLTQQKRSASSQNEVPQHHKPNSSSEGIFRQSSGSSSSHYAHSSDPREANDNIISHSSSLKLDVGALRTENSILRQQIERLQNKMYAFRKLEAAYERIDNEFTQTVTRREKQEKLEQTARIKMEHTIQRLANENELLQRQVEKLNLVVVQHHQLDPEQLLNYNALVNDIIPQHKELLAIKNSQQIEIDAQNATLEEQRKHIEMLEKALNNAQDRLLAKERAARDAAALVDKCTHQQKLLQEALDDKQKMQDEHKNQKTQLEMELAEVKMQVFKENLGPRKTLRSFDNEDPAKLKKAVEQKDDRISQLEGSLIDLQKRYNEELKNNDTSSKNEAELLTLENEKQEKDKKIQDLIEEKQRIHGQWADERRSLDHRVRLLEQDLKHLMGNQTNEVNYYSAAESPYSSMRQSHMGTLNVKPHAAVMPDVTMERMEELKQKISDKKIVGSAWNATKNGKGNRSLIHSRSVSSEHQHLKSNSSLIHSYMLPLSGNSISLVNPMGHHGSGASSSADSTTNSSESINNNHPSTGEPQHSPTGTSNRLASRMPSNYMENLPATTRRRITINSDKNGMSKKTAIALGTSGYKRPAWNASQDSARTNYNLFETEVEKLNETVRKDLTKISNSVSRNEGPEVRINLYRPISQQSGTVSPIDQVEITTRPKLEYNQIKTP